MLIERPELMRLANLINEAAKQAPSKAKFLLLYNDALVKATPSESLQDLNLKE